MHIGFYMSLIIIDFITIVANSERQDLILVICALAVYAICNFIFGLIVNKLATEILAITA